MEVRVIPVGQAAFLVEQQGRGDELVLVEVEIARHAAAEKQEKKASDEEGKRKARQGRLRGGMAIRHGTSFLNVFGGVSGETPAPHRADDRSGLHGGQVRLSCLGPVR